MKYVGLEEFMEMPAGTLYMTETNPKEPLYGFNGQLYVKGENVQGSVNDWYQNDIIDCDWFDSGELLVKVDAAITKGENLPIVVQPDQSRYADYPDPNSIRFWVLTEEDHRTLIDLLATALEARRQPR